MRFLSRLFIAVVTLSAALTAQTLQGTWTAERSEKEPDSLHMQFHTHGERGWMMGDSIRVSELQGLSLEALKSTGADENFSLHRDAGVVQFKGHFRDGNGVGEWTFAENPEYKADMAKQGYAGVSTKKMFELAIIDVSRAYAREIRDLGFKPSLDGLIEARIFKVNREQVEGMRAAGFEHLALDKLVELRVHEVTPEYIRKMRAAGFDVPLDKLIETKMFNVTPEFRQDMAALGYPDLSTDKLIEFRVHEITPEFVKQMGDLGFSHLSADDLVQARIFKVNASQVQQLKDVGYSGLTLDQLVQFRVHGIGPDFVRKVQQAGHQHPSVDDLVEMRIMGIPKAVAMY
ncbi:MAG TPA: hypothetical protein VGC88_06340 [Terriglobales bacterium]